MIHYINRIRNKTHVIISIDTENHSVKSNIPFMITMLDKLVMERTIKAICDKPKANLKLKVQKLESFYLRTGTRQGCSLSLLLFNIV